MFILIFTADTGGAEKITSLLNAYMNTMFNLAFAVLKNRQDAEDAVQDAVIGLLKHINDPVFDDPASKYAKAYIRETVKNAALKILGSRRLPEAPDPPLQDGDDLSDVIAKKELRDRLIEAINSLDEKYRDPLYMHYVLGCTVKEVAKLTKSKPDTVEKRITRAKKLIREKVDLKDYE